MARPPAHPTMGAIEGDGPQRSADLGNSEGNGNHPGKKPGMEPSPVHIRGGSAVQGARTAQAAISAVCACPRSS